MAKVAPLHKVGVALEPQAADPTSPRDGQIQMADGTVREEGLWRYNEARTQWVQVGSDFANPAEVEKFTAEDDDVTGFTNMSVTAVSPISDVRSYTVDSYIASMPVVTLDDRSKNRNHQAVIQHKMTSGTARIVIRDNAAAILVQQDITSTTAAEATLNFFVGPAVTSIQVSYEDVTSATGLIVDDVVLLDTPSVASVIINQVTEFRGLMNEGSTNTRVAYFPDATDTLAGAVFSYTNTVADGTIVTAAVACIMNIGCSLNDVGSSVSYSITRNLTGAELTTGSNPTIDQTKIIASAVGVAGTANGNSAVTELYVEAGDKLYVRISAAIVTPSDRNVFIISARTL